MCQRVAMDSASAKALFWPQEQEVDLPPTMPSPLIPSPISQLTRHFAQCNKSISRLGLFSITPPAAVPHAYK